MMVLTSRFTRQRTIACLGAWVRARPGVALQMAADE